MPCCHKCRMPIAAGEERRLGSAILCDECLLDAIWPKMGKTWYRNEPAEFMRRLKDTPPSRPQQFH